MDPRDVHAQLLPEIQDELLLVAAGYPVNEIGETFEKLSGFFQALGICHLLETADQEQFGENLVRSGYAWRYFLRKCKEQGNMDDRRLALSRTEAFLDACAAGQLELARDIVELSTHEWHPSWEYEDDFFYFRFLQDVVTSTADDKGQNADDILRRFEVALEGGESLRLMVCRAIQEGSKEGFSAALMEHMELIQANAEVQRGRMLEPDPMALIFWPRSFVSVEGLALLQVAELVGISARDSFPLCPDCARLPKSDRDCEDPFQGIETELAKG